MLDYNVLIEVLTCSSVHALVVIYLNTKSIRRPNAYFKLFAASFVIYFAAMVLIQKPYIYFPVTLFLLPLCTFQICRIGIVETFALSTIGDIIIIFGELIVQAMVHQFPDIDSLISGDLNYAILKNSLILLIMAMVLTTAGLAVKRKPSIKKGIKNMIYYVLFFAFINVVLNFLLLLSNTVPEKTYLYNLGFKTCFLILLIYILSVSSRARFEHRSKNYMQLSKYIRTIEEMYYDLAGKKHDFSNILFSINGYINENRINELREYLNNYVLKEYCKDMNNSFMSCLKYVQNPALKGIIFSKLNQAAMKNIKLFINIFSEIEINNIEPADLARIIGILLDNAIEACEKSPQNELHLGMESDKTYTSILIGNTCCQLPDLELISRRGYSTKGKNRGLGLYNLKKILALYPHAHLKTTVNNNMFFQELIIMK